MPSLLNTKEYIQGIRIETLKKIDEYLIQDNIRIGLEIGAGDGFQSQILIKYLDRLIVTEYSKDRLKRLPVDNIDYIIADAEKIEESIDITNYDIIYSSHLLEHLENPDKLLKSCSNMINSNGYIIHVVPSSWYAFFRLLFWYPSILVRFLNKLKVKRNFNLFKSETVTIRNNPSKVSHKRIKLFKFLFPHPHGVSKGLFLELLYMRKKYWENLFRSNNLKIIKVKKGLCFSGYGFGFKRSKRILSKLGIACEYIFILRAKK